MGYLDEYAFRFNRRFSTYHGMLFHRLVTQALGAGPTTYDVITAASPSTGKPESSA